MKYDVFVSYNHEQIRWVRGLVYRLVEAGMKPFFDEKASFPGRPIGEAIEEGMSQSKCALIVLTPQSVKSEWVMFEQKIATKMDPYSSRRFLIPLLRKRCRIPEGLRGIARIDCQTGLTKRTMEEILTAIRQRGAAELKGLGEPSHTWWWCNCPVDVNLSDMAYVNDSSAFVVGDSGTILRTLDGERTWTKLESGTERDLYAVDFGSEGKIGWVVGEQGTVLETADGGETWVLADTESGEDLQAVCLCENERALCCVGNGGVWRRKLSEDTWKWIPMKENYALWSVDFSWRGQLGCAVGEDGVILVSVDEGKTWKQVVAGPIPSLYSATVLPDEKTIWVVGDRGTVLVSRNGGKTWQSKPQPAKNWLNAADFSPDGKTGWIVGSHGTILNTIDGGDSWSSFHMESRQELVNIMYQDKSHAMIVGYGGVLMTTKAI